MKQLKQQAKAKPKQHKFNFDTILDKPAYLRIFSVLLAIVCWLVVALTISPSVEVVKRDIPINLENESQTLAALGLNIIEISATTVSANVQGGMATVARLEPEQLAATLKMTGVSEPKTYDLELAALNVPDGDYKIVSYSPPTVRVRFDRLVSQTFSVEPMTNGLSTAQDYTFDRETVTPDRVTVTGPQVDLDKIERCVVRVDLEAPLDKSFVETLPIILEDAQGNEISLDDHHLTMDQEEAQLVVRILKNKDLSLEVGFINEPRDFNVEALDYNLSNTGVLVAGPEDIVDRYRQLMVGIIDMKELRPSNSTFIFGVEMPSSDFVNLDNIYSVEVSFDSRDWAEETFSLDAEGIIVMNAPAGYDVSVLSDIPLSNITFVGDKETLEVMTADDIIAEVDLAGRTYETGQHSAPVRISAPTRGLVWAVGDYNVVIRVEERES